jgi:transcription elongation factor GreA-like protein
MDQRQVFENYLFEKHLAVSIAHILNEKKEDGMTDTDLAEVLHLSVPTPIQINFRNASVKSNKERKKRQKKYL